LGAVFPSAFGVAALRLPKDTAADDKGEQLATPRVSGLKAGVFGVLGVTAPRTFGDAAPMALAAWLKVEGFLPVQQV